MIAVWDVPPILQGLYIVAFGMLVLGLAAGRSWIGDVLSSRPLIWLGTVSYSLYLAHSLL